MWISVQVFLNCILILGLYPHILHFSPNFHGMIISIVSRFWKFCENSLLLFTHFARHLMSLEDAYFWHESWGFLQFASPRRCLFLTWVLRIPFVPARYSQNWHAKFRCFSCTVNMWAWKGETDYWLSLDRLKLLSSIHRKISNPHLKIALLGRDEGAVRALVDFHLVVNVIDVDFQLAFLFRLKVA